MIIIKRLNRQAHPTVLFLLLNIENIGRPNYNPPPLLLFNI